MSLTHATNQVNGEKVDGKTITEILADSKTYPAKLVLRRVASIDAHGTLELWNFGTFD